MALWLYLSQPVLQSAAHMSDLPTRGLASLGRDVLSAIFDSLKKYLGIMPGTSHALTGLQWCSPYINCPGKSELSFQVSTRHKQPSTAQILTEPVLCIRQCLANKIDPGGCPCRGHSLRVRARQETKTSDSLRFILWWWRLLRGYGNLENSGSSRIETLPSSLKE